MIGFLLIALVLIFVGLLCIGGLAKLWHSHDLKQEKLSVRAYKRNIERLKCEGQKI
jgi:hypothetical protein